jgi:hypothetical protein
MASPSLAARALPTRASPGVQEHHRAGLRGAQVGEHALRGYGAARGRAGVEVGPAPSETPLAGPPPPIEREIPLARPPAPLTRGLNFQPPTHPPRSPGSACQGGSSGRSSRPAPRRQTRLGGSGGPRRRWGGVWDAAGFERRRGAGRARSPKNPDPGAAAAGPRRPTVVVAPGRHRQENLLARLQGGGGGGERGVSAGRAPRLRQESSLTALPGPPTPPPSSNPNCPHLVVARQERAAHRERARAGQRLHRRGAAVAQRGRVGAERERGGEGAELGVAADGQVLLGAGGGLGGVGVLLGWEGGHGVVRRLG